MNIALNEILVCPLCNGKMKLSSDKLEYICTFDRLAFPVNDGIPVMLPESGRELENEEVEQYRS